METVTNTAASQTIVSGASCGPTNELLSIIERSSATSNGKEKFTGYFRDSETGNDYAVNRYMTPGNGRFITPDPRVAQAPIRRTLAVGTNMLTPEAIPSAGPTLKEPTMMIRSVLVTSVRSLTPSRIGRAGTRMFRGVETFQMIRSTPALPWPA